MTNKIETAVAITAADVLAFLGFKQSEATFQPEGSNVATVIPIEAIFTAHPQLLRYAVYHGMYGKLGNVSKGGLSKQLDRPATDADLKKARDKIVENWMNGDWNANRTGPRDSMVGDMREAFIVKQVGNGKTPKEADAMIRAAVTEAFGKDEKATFPKFLEAIATIKCKRPVADGAEPLDYDTVLKEVTDAAESAALKLRAERAESVAAIEVDTDNLF